MCFTQKVSQKHNTARKPLQKHKITVRLKRKLNKGQNPDTSNGCPSGPWDYWSPKGGVHTG